MQQKQAHTRVWICLALLITTFAVYAQVGKFGFLKFDDDEDVTANTHVLGGLTLKGVAWAFTSTQDANWFPLTRLSHMLDVQLFGLESGWHHGVNVLIHALAVLALFVFLDRATRAPWRSAFVALLFAIHPLHVESVAWVAERKDVLSALFWFLTLWAYVRYTENPTLGRKAITLLAFCLGVMSKPMVVTLPFVLLLLDYWPLRRLPLTPTTANHPQQEAPRLSWRQAIWEKIPFLLVSIAACIITYLAQKQGNAVGNSPASLRIENAVVSYATYLVKAFLPTGLAAFYPYPAQIPFWEIALAALAILAVSMLVFRSLRKQPFLAVGWLWFLGTLVPVIGIVQVGNQARADRYMYIPLVGLAIMATWGAASAFGRLPHRKTMLSVLAATASLVMVVTTSLQLRYWENTETLFQHAIDVTSNNYEAHIALANYLLDSPERLPDAVSHLQAAAQIRPDYAKAQYNLATALAMLPGRLPEAIAHYDLALRIDPDYAEAHAELATALVNTNRLLEAIPHYEAALRREPDSAHIQYNFGVALTQVPGRLADAIAHLGQAAAIHSDFDTEYALGAALLREPRRATEAVKHLEDAVRMNPQAERARQMLERAQAMAGEARRTTP